MPEITFLNPLAQLNGEQRFLEELKNCFQSESYSQLEMAVAFAKSGPFRRLMPFFKDWETDGKTIKAIFGIDHYGTTTEALEYALDTFTETYILHVETGTETSITFHPKIYIFSGEDYAVCFCGSHNFTVGGTETNLEWGVKIEFNLTEDEAKFNELRQMWEALLPDECEMCLPLTRDLLERLVADGLVINEKQSRQYSSSNRFEDVTLSEEASEPIFPIVSVVPPSPIPKEAFSKKKGKTVGQHPLPALPAIESIENDHLSEAENSASADCLVIEIIPHGNGEVHLSKIAVNQDPDFFEYPFTGKSLPKILTNQSYPQRTPDPLVKFNVFDANNNLIVNLEHHLNMVYYEKKSEIRITFPPQVRDASEEFSIMVMKKDVGEYDYSISIFNPGVPLIKDI